MSSREGVSTYKNYPGVVGKLTKQEAQLRGEVVAEINSKLRAFLLLTVDQVAEQPPRRNHKGPGKPNDLQKL